MSLSGLLNQTITPKPRSSYDVDGRVVTTTGTDTKARIQLKQKRRMLPNGSLIVTDGNGYLPPSSTLKEGDNFLFDSTEYLIFKSYKVPGANGSTHHIEIEFIKTKTS